MNRSTTTAQIGNQNRSVLSRGQRDEKLHAALGFWISCNALLFSCSQAASVPVVIVRIIEIRTSVRTANVTPGTSPSFYPTCQRKGVLRTMRA